MLNNLRLEYTILLLLAVTGYREKLAITLHDRINDCSSHSEHNKRMCKRASFLRDACKMKTMRFKYVLKISNMFEICLHHTLQDFL